MKATKREKDLALRGAENLNKLRIDANGMSLSCTEWLALFKKYKVPYYVYAGSRFIEQGILKEHDIRKHNGNIYSSYVLQDKPIHYSVLIPIYDRIRDRRKKRPRTFSIANHGVSIITASQEDRFKDFTDAELVQELRDRGFTVTAEKVTTIKL